MRLCPVTAFLIALSFSSRAQSPFEVRDEGRARDRTYDVLHYRIEVSFDESKKMVFGRTTTTLVPFVDELSVVELDAAKMDITRVTMGKTPLRFETQAGKLAITLDRPHTYKDTLALTVEYSCAPTRGLYFTQPDSAHPDDPWQIYSQGEDMDNHFWFPCYDYPNDLATSEMIVTVRSSYAALSNGRLVSMKEDKAKGTRTFHWKQETPHASYLIALAAGAYTVLRDTAGTIPLEYWVYPEHIDDARVCFARTPDMVRWFSDMIGYPYPWPKYAQVLIRDFVEGGMENTSATFLMDEEAVYDARARLDNSPTSLIAHELSHQWWGDVVTCRDWRDLWLNESFASYFDRLWHEDALGRDEFDYLMYGDQQSGINADRRAGRKPIVSVGSSVTNVYSRGATVLHMLRFVLGDRLFWRAMNHYITRHQHTAVETNDLKAAVEEATGLNLFWFFDQWVYKAGYPIFDLSYTWSDSAHALLLSVKQTQTIDSLTGVFRTPVDIELTPGNLTQRVTILSKDTVFILRAPSKPAMVIFDKGNWLLKELHWAKTTEEWAHQAEFATNPVDRLRAVQELAQKGKDSSFIPLFCRLALNDRFWGVRREAVAALEGVKPPDETQKAAIARVLVAASADRKSEVRQSAVLQLRGYTGDSVVAAVRTALKDSSYRVAGNALRALAKVDSAHALPVILSSLDVPSYRNTIAMAALGALSSLDTARALQMSLAKAAYGQPLGVRAVALGILGRYGRGRPEVKRLYVAVLEEKPSFLLGQAIRWLGDYGDESAIPALEKITEAGEGRSAEGAKKSLEKIRTRLEGRNERGGG